MAAGRASLEEIKLNQLAFVGKVELQRRFGTEAVLTVSWELREDGYWVDVMVQPADGSVPMCFSEPLDEFPSDECIANIALVT